MRITVKIGMENEFAFILWQLPDSAPRRVRATDGWSHYKQEQEQEERAGDIH